MPGRPLEIIVPTLTENVRIEWAVAFATMAVPTGQPCLMTPLGRKPLLDIRNGGILDAKEKGAEFLMFWDDDVVPLERSALLNLYATMKANPQISVLGGIYPRRIDVAPEPIVIEEPNGGVWWGWEDGGVHKVWMTGTGFTMIRVDDFDDVDVPEHELASGKKVPKLFGKGGVGHLRITDDAWFANVCREYDKTWCVHGGVVCIQIDHDGTRYSIEDARPAKLEESLHETKTQAKAEV